MGAGKSNSTPTKLAGRFGSLFARASRLPPGLLLGSALFVVTVVSVVYGWRNFGRTVVARPIYRLAAENIQVSPPPAWIKTDVRAEVVRDGALHDLTIFDKDATIRVYQAFEIHPWVAKVLRVSKHPPARLDVELTYRRPVAWVEVPRGNQPGEDGGVIPVDSQAVVLPSRDFGKDNLQDYLRIAVPNVGPYGLAGTAWGDARVVGAARIATALEGIWAAMHLYRVRVVTDETLSRSQPEPLYELELKTRQRLVWGNPPGLEKPEEPSATAKLDRLAEVLEKLGALDKLPAEGFDLRQVGVPIERAADRSTNEIR